MTLTRSDEMRALAYAAKHPEHVAHIKRLFDALMALLPPEPSEERSSEGEEGEEGGYPTRQERATALPSHLKHAHKIVWRSGVPVGLDASPEEQPGKSRAFYCKTEGHWKALAQYFLGELSRHHARLPSGASVERLSPKEIRVRLTKKKPSETPTGIPAPFTRSYRPVFNATLVLRAHAMRTLDKD